MVTETSQDLNQGKIKKEQGNVEIWPPTTSQFATTHSSQPSESEVPLFVTLDWEHFSAWNAGSHPEFMTQPVNHHQNNNQSSTSLSEVTLTLHAVGYCQSGEDIKKLST